MANILKNNPLISVIIPAYNHERFIAAAVDSVLQQSVSDFELVVIDDGSKDRTGEIVQSFQDPRLTYIFQENRDAYNTINRGLSLAKGHYISILNSDDVYSLNRLEKLLEASSAQAAECVFSDVIPISDNGERFTDPEFGWNVWHRKNREWYFSCNDVYCGFLKGNFLVTTSNLFMTAKAARKVGNFCSLRYLHDYDYIFRIMLAYPGGVHYLHDEQLLYYRIHSGNTLSEAAIIGREQDQQVITIYLAAKLPDEYRRYVLAGADRLIELGNELHAVKQVLKPATPLGVRPACSQLLQSLKTWSKKKLRPFTGKR